MKLTDYMLECERRAYLATGNPMHAWNAYATARARGVDLPEWVLQYLNKASWGLREIVSDNVSRKDLGPRIARALDLVTPGRGTPFDQDTWWWAFGRKVRELKREGYPLHHARWKAAEFYDVSESTIIRGAKVYDEVFPEGDEELEIAESDLPVFLPKRRRGGLNEESR